MDSKEALNYFEKAAENNVPIAITTVGYYYENGIKVNRDIETAY